MLLGNLGITLPATDLQIGLNFAVSSPELFARKEMGQDALRLISDYRTRLASIRSTIVSESKLLCEALKWGKGLGKNCRVSRRDAEMMNQDIRASVWTRSGRGFGLDLERAVR
jgi:hypothetical protein